MPARIIETKRVSVNDVKPYPGNARRGNISMIRESLRTNGQYRAIVVNAETMEILAGNHTWQAAVDEGWDAIDATFVEATPEQARKIVLVDNKSNDEADYSNEALADLLNQLEGDFDGTGFGEADLTKLLDSLEPAGGDAGTGFGALHPRVSEGDVWKLGPHRLMCGNALSLTDLGELMDGCEARLVITSPPYNQQLDGFKASGMQKEAPNWVERMASAYEDSKPEEEYQAEQLDMLANLHEVTTSDASVFYNHKHRYRDREVLSPLRWLWSDRNQWRLRQEIVWDRGTSITLNAKMFMPVDERIYWLTRGDTFIFNDTPEIKAFQTIWPITPRTDAGVSAPFPQEIPQRCITAASLRGDIVLDPYVGSGTTILACEAMGRIGYGMELNPEYCDVAIARWESVSGMKAVLDGE